MSIVWPEHYVPDRVAARVSNEITISAPPATVWAWFVRASLWPTWYPNSDQVQITGGARDLSAGAKFKWRTFGVGVSSTVREFEPHSRIAWDGKGPFLDVYHAWLIEPRGGGRPRKEAITPTVMLSSNISTSKSWPSKRLASR